MGKAAEQAAEESEEVSEETISPPIEWTGERIDAADALRERGAAYGMYVNTMRALPDIRDGLKSVQRRIVFSMTQNNQVFSRGTTKCARIVGDTMGKYHPHGDSSIYDALVRLGQTFTVNQTLISPQGNFGSVDGDPAAAMRYTEAKLSQIASEWKPDIRPEVLPYRANFDESTREPIVLPVSFPVLLVNGSQGIGWSLACDVPPHNLGEAIDAALLIADKPEATLSQVLKKMPAPDYPSGGVLIAASLEEAYKSGRGSFTLQGKYHLDTAPGGGQAVIITELPYQIGPSQVFQEIIDGAKNEKITEITEKPVNLTSKKGTRLVVKLKRGGNAQALIAQLLKYTSLQVSQKINFTVLRDGNPSTVDLLELLRSFVNFRNQVVTKRLEHERAVLLKELKRLTALRAALDVIEKVIKIIREAKDDEQARTKLKAAVKVKPYGKTKQEPIDDEQAENILSMQLRRLNQLNRFQLDEEIEEKTERCREIDRILGDPQAIMDIVKEELKAVKKAYAHERLTHVTESAADLSADGGTPLEDIEEEPIVLWATRSGRGMAVSPSRKTKGAPISVGPGDSLKLRLEGKTTDSLLIFSSSGSAFRLRAGDLGVEEKKNRGNPLASLDKSEQLAGVVIDGAEPYIVMVTEKGQVKRIGADVLKGAHAGGMQAVKIEDDKLIAALAHSDKAELIVVSEQGRVLRVELDALRPVKSGTAGPVKLMKLKDGDRIVSACLAEGDSLLVLHDSGMGKLVPMQDIPTKGRGGGGVALTSPDKPAKSPAGPVALIAGVSGGEANVALAEGKIEKLAAQPGTRASVVKPASGENPALVIG